MITCCECGSSLAPDENFCGSCGARRQRDDTPVVSGSGSVSSTDNSASMVSNYSHKLAEDGSTWTEESQNAASTPAEGHRGTGEIVESAGVSSKTSRADAVPDKRPKPKALAGGKILNGRYEIVRRIGGGGMGALYLAKNRNPGGAPRPVKEMMESHIADPQHRKTTSDFKGESHRLHEL